jgi:Carboxypeptidase regulatory-like domain
MLATSAADPEVRPHSFQSAHPVVLSTTQGQAPLFVGFQKRVEIALAGATAAYSLDPYIADATATGGIVEIFGKAPGTTHIVIVTNAGVQSLTVSVTPPASALPPGMQPEGSQSGETGVYEFRYNSDPGQITNGLEVKRSQGQSFDRVQIVNATLLSTASSTSTVGFPLLSYEINRVRTDYTFLDQMVSNSPLTVDGFLVRGVHVRVGDWQFHGGFSSVATFQGLFLATDPEYVAGLSRNLQLDSRQSLQANLYYFQNPSHQQLANTGGLGTIAYRYNQKDKASFLAELGAGHGMALAAKGTFDDEKNHIIASLRATSSNLASLAVNTQRGTFADANASRKFNERWYGSLNVNASNFNLPALKQDTFTTSAIANYKLNRSFTLTSGTDFSRFKAIQPAGPTLTTVNLPAGVDFSQRHFGAGFQYQRTINFDGSGGNDYSANLRASAGQFHGSAFFRHDVQVPTVSAIFSQIPGLQDALLRAGITASTPDQIAELLRNTALLETLGFSNLISVNLAPARNDRGATLTWLGKGSRRQQVDFNYFRSDTDLLTGKLSLATTSLSYAQRLTANDDLVGSAAWVRTVSNGVTDRHPLFSVSLQHRFHSFPSFILPGRHGYIEGHVFRDDDSTGNYNGTQPPLSGVEIRLDDGRVTHSDSSGFYSFHHVPYGVHRVEAKLHTDDSFFYTTDSPARSDINQTIDFGISYAKGQVFGYVLNDAGAGVGSITVELQGGKLTQRMATAGNGKFSFAGLPSGTYTVATVADTFPAGYSLQGLAPQQVTVEPGKPSSLKFSVKALRSIAGRVLVYDKTVLKPVPLAGAKVHLVELSLETTTAENGGYMFRNLPPGTYVIKVEYNGKETTHAVTLSERPASLRDIDLNVGSK